ncbi:glycosyltransferase family 39 protein, partial [Candidatus Falkowbacteria bacterium]|nr:glycosyltransferase family 39 protein [Candidatus Falkowbacteria bacterium]
MKVLADKKQIILLLVMTLAALFIFINLGRPDVIHDETIISFRALGYIDFFAESGQTTTLDWYQRPPWWTKLSFHDHQPFGYILNYIFLNLFGTSAFVVRLVSALAGLSSVFLVYLIGRRLFGENAGLLAGFIFAINNFSLWIARIAFQESLVIALALSSLYFFLLALERKYCLILSALLLGLAFITKYTAIFILPVYLVILLINKRSWFKTKEFYLSLIVFLIIISPVVLYNVFLFADRGHFDLQLPYLFGLTGKVAGWDNLVGKSDLSFWQRYASLPFELTKYLSPLFLVTSLVALAYLFWLYKRDKFNILMLVLSLVSVLLLIGLVGPQERFLTMFMPFLALAISLFFITLFTRPKALRFTLGFLIIFASYEIFYSINSLHFINSIGRPPYAYSDFVKRIRGDWGFNNLDKYLSRELAGKVPERRFALSHPYLEEKFF